ncbi:MAG: PorV/PorQ family protein [Endomicrobiales bacterium]
MKNRGLAIAVILIAGGGTASFAAYSPADPPVLYAPVSGRSTALGNSLFCAESEGIRYNPAYLGALEKSTLFGTYGVLQRGSSFGGAYGQFRAGAAAVGLGITDLRTQGIEKFTGPDTDPAGEITASQSLFSLAAGMRGSDKKLLLGAALRLLVDAVENESSVGYSLDAGAGYLFNPRWRAGLVLNNVLSLYDVKEDIVPQKTTLALSYMPDFLLSSSQKKEGANTLFLAASKGLSSNTSFSFGWESVFYGTLAARLGYDRDYPVLGLGLGYPFGSIDLAAAFKGSGPLFFVTLGFTFAPPSPAPPVKTAAQPVVKPEAKKVKKAKEPKEPAAAPSEAASLAREGWAMLKGNNVKGALKNFNAALALDPGEPSATAGLKAAEREMNGIKKQESYRILLAQAARALQAGDYAKAEELYRQTMELDPENGDAREGIRAVVEAVSTEIGESLKKGATWHFTPEQASLEEALIISGNGTFGNLEASRRFLADEKYGAAWAEWQKVKPRDIGLVRKYNEAFALLPPAVYNAAAGRASKKAAQGYYRDAVTELEKNCRAEGGLPVECTRKAQALISTYEYVGQSVSRSNLTEAEKLIAQRQYRPAAACLERVVRSGYDADKAQRRLREIKTFLKEGRAGGESKKQGGDEGAPPSPPVPSGNEGSVEPAEKPSSPPPLDGRLKESLLNAYMTSAEKLFIEKRYRECRECLLKVLYLDPGNSEARRSLEKVNRFLKQEGNKR